MKITAALFRIFSLGEKRSMKSSGTPGGLKRSIAVGAGRISSITGLVYEKMVLFQKDIKDIYSRRSSLLKDNHPLAFFPYISRPSRPPRLARRVRQSTPAP